MKAERWHEIERLYRGACECRPEERAAFLAEACAGNESLRKEVESLLASRPKADEFFQSQALKAMATGLAEDESTGLPGGDASRNDGPKGRAEHRPGARRQMPRWWIMLLSVPIVSCAGFLLFRLVFGPEPVGWTLKRVGTAVCLVTSVRPQSAAAQGGFEHGDLIPSNDLDQFLAHSNPNEQHHFHVERRGEVRGLTVTLKRKGPDYWVRGEGIRSLLLGAISLLYLTLAGTLALVRPQDTQARWGALLLAQLGLVLAMQSLDTVYPLGLIEQAHALRTLPALLGLAILAGMSISMMVPAGAFGFLGGFPRTPFTGRRAWLLIWVPAVLLTVPIDLSRIWLPAYAGANGPLVPVWLIVPGWVVGLGYLAASPILLMRNYNSIKAANERRRLRIVIVGFGITIFAFAVGMAAAIPWGPVERFRTAYFQGSYLDFMRSLLLAAAPISTTYAILRHRMFDIHMIVRLGLRYAAARGLILSLAPAMGLILGLDVLTHGNQPLTEIVRRRGLLYLAIALCASLLHTWQRVWLNALDRRFFREHYDGQRLLSAVVDDIRRAPTFEQAASHAISRIEGSLHPEVAGLMVRRPGAPVYHAAACACGPPRPIPARSKLVALMQLLDKPLENSQSQPSWLRQQLPREEAEYLQETRIEWLFPIALGGTGTEAILLLGPKRSEEPYSREDRELLSAITGSLALFLERLRGPASLQPGFGECPECGHCYDAGIAQCETDGERLKIFPYSRTLAQRYLLERRLGRGGMGIVYQARDIELERPVAIKVIRTEIMASAEAEDRFRREAKAAAGFSHPNVVTVHDFGVSEDNRAYLVMELLSGCSLREELLRSGPLESKRVLGILSGVCAAVAAAHERKLLHRDIKPENIFLAQSGQAEVAKILDFGLAKPITPNRVTESISGTAPGVLVGTLPSISPEQIRGGAPAGGWDLWALAVVAFEMLAGVHPFGTSVDWRSVLIENRIPPLTAEAPALTLQLRKFFERSLAADCSRRPSTAQQFIIEFEAAMLKPNPSAVVTT